MAYKQSLTPHEIRLRDEVIYLHSLWHRDPPSLTNPDPIPCIYTNNPSRNLHALPSTSFKKLKRKKSRRQNANATTKMPSACPGSYPPSDPFPDSQRYKPLEVSDVLWPLPKPIDEFPSTSSGWPKLNPQTLLKCVASAEIARYSRVQLQQRFVEKCKSFLSVASGSESSGDEEDSDYDVTDEDMSDKCEEFNFFMHLFIECNELRDYYEKHYEDGKFCCLVCGAMGKKIWKKYKGCAGLLQHATTISRTKKKTAHRAFGQVVCKVLGWDVNRLPTIVLKGETLSWSLANLGLLQTRMREVQISTEVNNVAENSSVDDPQGSLEQT